MVSNLIALGYLHMELWAPFPSVEVTKMVLAIFKEEKQTVPL
jgi:hypothetical protein